MTKQNKMKILFAVSVNLRSNRADKNLRDKFINNSNSLKNMKNKIIGVITFTAIAVAAGCGYIQNKQNVVLSDLAMENIEALARWEDPNEAQGFEKKDCYKNG